MRILVIEDEENLNDIIVKKLTMEQMPLTIFFQLNMMLLFLILCCQDWTDLKF